MTYKQLADTFNMLASKKPNGFVMPNTMSGVSTFKVSIFHLQKFDRRDGWPVIIRWDEEEMGSGIIPQKHTDEEIVEVFNRYKSIYKYA